MRSRHRVVLALLAAAGALAPIGNIDAAEASTTRDVPREKQLIGTVRTVDAQSRTFDVLTGVGHALRIRRFHLATQPVVRARGAQVAPSRLRPGKVVRVEYETTRTGSMATTVEILQPAPAARTP